MTTPATSRRRFLKQAVTAASAFGFQVVPSRVFGANERLHVAAIGAGGKGSSDIDGVAKAGGVFAAYCDVDDTQLRRIREDGEGKGAPRAPFYKDFRMMLEKEEKNIDAVTVSTPDHIHCHAAVWAMRMGKHVYCQKPLAHSVWEARLMATVAREQGVATQMGNQAHAGEPIRRAVELVRAGVIGKVREVHTWTNRPIWPQGIERPLPAAPIPNKLDWYLWLGPAPDRPYHPEYAPFKWRGWWDFGTGALGDMGCHIMDMPFWALDLKAPLTVEAESSGNTAQSGPISSKVTYTFPEGLYNHPLTFCWYDGFEDQRRMPDAAVFEGTGFDPVSAQKFDLIMIGDKGKFLFNRGSTKWVYSPESLREAEDEVPQTIPRVENEDAEWVAACRGGSPALSNFDYSGPFTETVLLGNVAIRLGSKAVWDAERLKVTNAPEAAGLVKRAYRDGWNL